MHPLYISISPFWWWNFTLYFWQHQFADARKMIPHRAEVLFFTQARKEPVKPHPPIVRGA